MGATPSTQLFDGTEFFVNKAVMIPRKSTEAIVHTAVDVLNGMEDNCGQEMGLFCSYGGGNRGEYWETREGSFVTSASDNSSISCIYGPLFCLVCNLIWKI